MQIFFTDIMYVNIDIADETYTNCALPGLRLQQGRFSDVWLPKRCSSRNSQRPSYKYSFSVVRTSLFLSADQTPTKTARGSSRKRRVYNCIRLSCTILCYQIQAIDRTLHKMYKRMVTWIDCIVQVKYISLTVLLISEELCFTEFALASRGGQTLSKIASRSISYGLTGLTWTNPFLQHPTNPIFSPSKCLNMITSKHVMRCSFISHGSRQNVVTLIGTFCAEGPIGAGRGG